MSDPEFGEWLANELASSLDEMLAESELCAVRGQKSVGVRLSWANKGEVAARMVNGLPESAFKLAIGDDRTDEASSSGFRTTPGPFTWGAAPLVPDSGSPVQGRCANFWTRSPRSKPRHLEREA
jgi:trehalose-6-phosphatase